MEKDLIMGFFGILFSGVLTASVITYFFGGGEQVFFSTAVVACFLTDMLFGKRDKN
jgi:hypothetical protein